MERLKYQRGKIVSKTNKFEKFHTFFYQRFVQIFMPFLKSKHFKLSISLQSVLLLWNFQELKINSALYARLNFFSKLAPTTEI